MVLRIMKEKAEEKSNFSSSPNIRRTTRTKSNIQRQYLKHQLANLRTSAKTRKVHMLQLRVAYILMTTQEGALQLQNDEYCAKPASPSKSTRKSVSQKHEPRRATKVNILEIGRASCRERV